VLKRESQSGLYKGLIAVFGLSFALFGGTARAFQGNAELQTGTQLTGMGRFAEAIPHLLAAKKAEAGAYAAAFNLAICYLGLGAYREAVAELEPLRPATANPAAVRNLLAQAYLGEGDREAAWREFEAAAAATPRDEKLYAFVADACTDHREYELGLRVVEEGLRALPDSARLHYERGLFLAELDRMAEADPEFERASILAPESYIASLAKVQGDLYRQDSGAAILLLRELAGGGHRDARTLSLLGTVLLQNGAKPGEPEFAEAQSALEESVKISPRYSATQIALGKMALMLGRLEEAREHLELARSIEPGNPAVYTNLVGVYRKLGDAEKARVTEEQLSKLLEKKAPVAVVTNH